MATLVRRHEAWHHVRSCLQQHDQSVRSMPLLRHVHAQAKACRLMFKGLRVRMSVATGVCQEVKVRQIMHLQALT